MNAVLDMCYAIAAAVGFGMLAGNNSGQRKESSHSAAMCRNHWYKRIVRNRTSIYAFTALRCSC